MTSQRKILFLNLTWFQIGSILAMICLVGGLILEYAFGQEIGGLLSAIGMLYISIFILLLGIRKHYFMMNKSGILFRLSGKEAKSINIKSLTKIKSDENHFSFLRNDVLQEYDLSGYSLKDRQKIKTIVEQSTSK